MLHGLDDLTPIQQSGKTIVSGGAAHRFAGGDQFLLHHDQPLANQQTSLEFQFVETLGQEKSSTPASIALSRSARPLFAVSRIVYTYSSRASWLRSFRHSSTPSIPGMTQSIRASTGAPGRLKISHACNPFVAARTSKPHSRRCAAIKC